MTELERYATAAGVELAIKQAASQAAKVDPSLSASTRIELEYFNRFLSRVFSDGEHSGWVLKGGTGILARVPSSRATRDIDLFCRGVALDQARRDLIRVAATDLGDHFRFEYAGHTSSIGTDNQPHTDGYQVRFDVYIGVARKSALKVDVAVGLGPTGEVVTTQAATSLPLPRLVTNPYRLYPIVDQIADKVCATMSDYNGKPSSREKDLVDLVVFAVTQDIDGTSLRAAITIEALRRKMPPIQSFVVPGTWGRGYAKQSKPVPYCADYPSVAVAGQLVARLVDPAVIGDADDKTWSHAHLAWH